MTPFRAFVEEVRSRSDIVEVIGADVTLRPSGKVLKGLSPFNRERNLSFVVWPANQSWHDFSNGGGRGGDVLAYIQERDRCGFKEALLHLAERGGLKRPGQSEAEHARELALVVDLLRRKSASPASSSRGEGLDGRSAMLQPPSTIDG